MPKLAFAAIYAALVLLAAPSQAQLAAPAAKPAYDAELARSLGASENGMRSYVFVLLRTGPNKVPAGPERDEMFKGHFANMKRLSDEGQLALAGPFDGVDGWRGLFIFAVEDIEEARKLVATDPVVVKGEMTPEFHKYYGSAALMTIRDVHDKLVAPKRP
jgi:uncharacterized protein YciI